MASPFKMKASSGDKTEIPQAGNHPAVLVAMIDLGTHEDDYQGKKSWVRKVYLVWELTAEKMAGMKDRNHVISRSYNLSFGAKSNLRQLIEGWRGKSFGDGEEFDLSQLLGKKCLVTVVHDTSSNGRTYAKIKSVTQVPKGMTVPEPKHTAFCWSIGDPDDYPEPDWVPYLYGEDICQVIARAREYKQDAPAKDEVEIGAVQNDEPDPF